MMAWQSHHFSAQSITAATVQYAVSYVTMTLVHGPGEQAA